MRDKIIELLLLTTAKGRQRMIKKQNLSVWFSKNYEGIPLNIAIDSVLNGTNPFCSVCGSPVKTISKKTCSTRCRSKSLLSRKDEIVEKRRVTSMQRYGVTNITKLKITQDKRIATNIKLYGRKVSPITSEKTRSRTDELNSKGRKTLFDKHGIINAGQLANHKEKCKTTLLKNFGIDSYFKSDEFKKISMARRYESWRMIFPSSIELLNITTDEDKAKIFDNPCSVLKISCYVCGTIDNIPTETAKWRTSQTGTPCIKCSGINQGSIAQLALRDFIESLGIKTQLNHVLKNNKQVDILCSNNIGFEYDGLYWHNDLRKDKNYHWNKTLQAQVEGIRLIHIFEDEWLHCCDIVKSRIRNLFGVTESRIYARKCVIKRIDTTLEKKFLIENHIQGYARSVEAVGLYYDSILVSVMSFGKPNAAKGQVAYTGHFELLRFCSLQNTSVVGGAGKLLGWFIKTHSPEQIVSFADRRWSLGDLYLSLGFTKRSDTAANYWYIDAKNIKRIHRYKLRKNTNDDQTLTEYQNRQLQGYLRIWDCGSSKWTLTRPQRSPE